MLTDTVSTKANLKTFYDLLICFVLCKQPDKYRFIFYSSLFHQGSTEIVFVSSLFTLGRLFLQDEKTGDIVSYPHKLRQLKDCSYHKTIKTIAVNLFCSSTYINQPYNYTRCLPLYHSNSGKCLEQTHITSSSSTHIVFRQCVKQCASLLLKIHCFLERITPMTVYLQTKKKP